MDSRISPGNLATPLELGWIVLVVEDQCGNLGLTVAFEAYGVIISYFFGFQVEQSVESTGNWHGRSSTRTIACGLEHRGVGWLPVGQPPVG